jgi:serpin B
MSADRFSRRRFLALAGAAGAAALFPTRAGAAETALSKLVNANAAFALDLYRKLATGKSSTFFSPFSLSAALAMTSAGARGKTFEQMRDVLHLPDEAHATFGKLFGFVNGTDAAKRKHELVVANSLWGMKGWGWRKEYLELLQNSYKAELLEVDFTDPDPVRTQINDWVSQHTKEKIKDLIPAGGLTPLTRLVLANAVYFKGAWADKFNKNATKDAPFTHADGTKADAPLMMQPGHFDYAEYKMSDKDEDLVQVLALPYDGNKATMLVFLPKDPAGIGRLADWIKPKHLAFNGDLKSRRVDLHLPRFKAETNFSLKDVLVDMGMKEAFDDNAADFTGMHTGKDPLFIAAVRHKAFVDVNEEGTEAAAASSVELATKGAPPPEITVFRADRPFLFAIRDETTDSILFLGRYCGPKA